mmetsp:Transcript_7504/g.19546  ORF Transcript_7504/g.19546 Transcript_7504/m.19546 type:complete len:169 (-) Transcript_7504:39-545(-)
MRRHEALSSTTRASSSRGPRRARGEVRSRTVTTEEALVRRHELVRDDDKDRADWDSWETRMAVRYYRRLHKEYAIVDLSRWREGQCGLRWRTEAEVLAGVGETTCAARRCREVADLRTFEVPFAYSDPGDAKTKCELVKVRVCAACGDKLATLGGTPPRSAKRRRTSE